MLFNIILLLIKYCSRFIRDSYIHFIEMYVILYMIADCCWLNVNSIFVAFSVISMIEFEHDTEV